MDEQKTARSKTAGETIVDTAPEQSETADTIDTLAPDTAQTDAGAEGAADVPDANESRTGVAAKGLRRGDPCKCPDGRKGTVHSFDAGLICIPNADQG
jgi:hypothetical protein